MADRNTDREPRWTNTGYWTERDEEEERTGDRERARNYNREDQRRYGRRSQSVGERLRRLRGQAGEPRQEERWGNYPRERFERARIRPSGYSRHARPPYRGYGMEMGRDSGWRDRGRFGSRSPGWERETRGSRLADEYGIDYSYEYEDFGPSEDLVVNQWGRRELRQRGIDQRRDFTSARRYEDDDRGLSPRGSREWGSSEEYDRDPGFAYEFGTRYDFDDSMDAFGRPGAQDREGRGRERYRLARPAGRRAARQRRGWDTPGPYSGVGPRSYRRSHERITDEIYDLLSEHGQIDARGIQVEVEDGEVSLRGEVDNTFEKYLAEDIAASVMGVQDVYNHIRVTGEDDIRVRGMGREDVVMPGRIQEGMRVAGVDGKRIGLVRSVHMDGFFISREDKRDAFIPFRAVKRTNGQIVLHLPGSEIDRQGWRSSQR